MHQSCLNANNNIYLLLENGLHSELVIGTNSLKANSTHLRQNNIFIYIID